MAWWLFQNVVVTAVLVAAVALVCRFGRIGPVARHALWVLVLIKFITPPLVVWPWAMPDPLGLVVVDAVPPSPEPLTRTLEPPNDVVPASAQPAVEAERRSVDTNPPAPGITFWLLAAWIIGSVCLLALELVRLARLVRRVRTAGPADPAIVNRVAVLSQQLGLRQRLDVKELPGSTSPVVWCVGRPVLLWPADLPPDASDACIDGLIVHELAHIERRDHIVGWIELVAGVAWWWNPLFWFVRSALREQAELACDAWVISALPNGRRAYAESLLTLSSIAGPSTMSKSMAAVIGVRASSRRVLERRLVMIMKGRAPLRLPSVGLFTLVVVAAATLPAWATADQHAQPPPPQAHQQQMHQQPRAPQTHQEQSHATQAQAGQQHQMASHAQRPTAATQPRPTTHVTEPHPSTAQHAAPAAVPSQMHNAAPSRQATTAPPAPRQQPARPTAQSKPVPADKELAVYRMFQDKNGQPLFAGWANAKNLPADAQKALTTYESDREAIEKEIEVKLQARRDKLTKDLQALQEEYTKAGKLDEAVAIRDYLRAGGPNQPNWRIGYPRR